MKFRFLMRLLIRLLTVPAVRFREIKTMVRAGEFGGPDRIQELFTWQRERMLALAKGIAATVVSLLTTILVMLLKQEIKADVDTWHVVVLAVGTLLSATYAGYLAWRLSRLPAEYAAAIRLFKALARANPTFPSGPWK
jgi:hypothetical protein